MQLSERLGAELLLPAPAPAPAAEEDTLTVEELLALRAPLLLTLVVLEGVWL